MNATHETDTPAPSMATMRASASWFILQKTLLGHRAVRNFEEDFRTFLDQLIPDIEKLATGRPQDDVPANVALAGVEEAHRRMAEPEAAGLRGEVDRVKQLAQSVMSLSHHHDTLTGITMCPACDRVIPDEDEWVPYDHGSPSGGTARSGRVHARCAKLRR
jgi:hypothetical protein